MARNNQSRRGGAPPGSGAGPSGGGQGYPVDNKNFLDNMFAQQDFPNMLKQFVHPGKGDPKELLMRCYFKDERERNAAVLYYAKCVEFDLKEEMEVLADWLAATVSVRGLSRRELLMGATGIIAPTLYEDGEGKKKRRWRDKTDGKEGNE